MKKGDFVLLGVTLCLLGLVIFIIFFKPSAGYAVVYEDGTKIAGYPLNTDITEKIVTKDGHYNILQISNGEVSVLEADCKNQICVNTRPVKRIGDSIICLPHKISIVLEKDRKE